LNGQSSRRRIEIGSHGVQPLVGTLVVDFTRLLPGAYASRELVRLGARAVRVEAPDADPMRHTARKWDERLRSGTESVVCDLRSDVAFAQALCRRADVVLEGFRPGVAEQIGIGPDDVPRGVVYCSITGFGADGRHVGRAGHDLNYLGWAGALEDTAPSLPPIQVADLAAGALVAVTRILAALLERERTGLGSRVVVSMTHGAHDLVAHRLGGDPVPHLLTGGLASYRIYATADGRYLTVGALEPKFFIRFCEVVGRPELASRQYDTDQESLASELAAVIEARPLAEWLALFDREDVCAGPVATLEEAAAEFGSPTLGHTPSFGEHTRAWRDELGFD
jgi:alpha-methylacyl-CoA racemase